MGIVRMSPWEQQHRGQIEAGAQYIAEHGATPDTPIWQMLEHRYELDEARFRHWHPVTAGILDRIEHPENHVLLCGCHEHKPWMKMRGPHEICFPPPTCPPISPPCQPIVPVPPLNPQTVPEPKASTMLAVALLGLAAWSILIGKGK